MPISPELTEKVVFTSHHSAPTFTVLLCAVYILSPFGTKPDLKTQWCKLCKWNNLEMRFSRKNSRPALLLWLLAAGPRVRTAPSSAMGRESPAPAGAPCRRWWHHKKWRKTKEGKGTVRSVCCGHSHGHTHTGTRDAETNFLYPQQSLGILCVCLIFWVFSFPFTAITVSPDPMKYRGVCSLCGPLQVFLLFLFFPFFFFLEVPVN